MKISSILKVAGTVASVVGAYKAGLYLGETGMLSRFCEVEKTNMGSASLVSQETIIQSNPRNVVSEIKNIHNFSEFMILARVTTVGLVLSDDENGNIHTYLQDLRAAFNDMVRCKLEQDNQ